MDNRRLLLGVLLIVASTAVVLAVGVRNTSVPLAVAGLAPLGLAAGALLVGLSEPDAAV